jgi:hypothetical protein
MVEKPPAAFLLKQYWIFLFFFMCVIVPTVGDNGTDVTPLGGRRRRAEAGTPTWFVREERLEEGVECEQ